MASKVRYLICYDIRDPQRLLKIMRAVRKQAIPLQYSVCYADLYTDERDQLIQRLEILMDKEVDDIRFYVLGPYEDAVFIGENPFIDKDNCLVVID
ncbi:CRISPR-associated endonuclease Cas2 [Serratia sp. S1B]|nr:CRISPR-associated endonuclease Cas2 [Serratia sp. S1B]